MPLATPDPTLAHLPERARTLGFLLREVYSQLQQRVYNAVAAAGHSGIRPMHSPVLRHLPPEGGRVSDIARETGLAKQSVAYVVEDLVALGYLRTEPDPNDGRARLLRFTARGRRLLGALVNASHEAEAWLASILSDDRLRSLRDMLETVVREAPLSRAGRAKPAPRSSHAAPEDGSIVIRPRVRR